jgi:hypothetical protein
MNMDQQQKKHGIARRAVVGVGKAWSYSIGLTSLARELGRIGGNVAAVGGYVRRKLADGPQNYRHESFHDAVERMGLDEVHLLRRARLFRAYAIWNFVAMMVATVWLAYVPFTDRPTNAFFVTLGLIVATCSQWLTWHYRFCQIRDHDLDRGFSAWLMNPGRW